MVNALLIILKLDVILSESLNSSGVENSYTVMEKALTYTSPRNLNIDDGYVSDGDKSDDEKSKRVTNNTSRAIMPDFDRRSYTRTSSKILELDINGKIISIVGYRYKLDNLILAEDSDSKLNNLSNSKYTVVHVRLQLIYNHLVSVWKTLCANGFSDRHTWN